MNALRAGFLLRTGLHLQPSQLESFIETLDEAFMLESQRFRIAINEMLLNYRSAPFRSPALAGEAYPSDASELLASLDDYCRRSGDDGKEPSGVVMGVISPHIDYMRGWRTYAQTWQRARRAVEQADLVILLGTDHSGSPGSFTLTRQDYSTPWGPLPTDTDLVGRLAEVFGEESAFGEEVHHIGEHSVELALVWLHYAAGGKPKRLLPILCGPHEALLDTNGRDSTPVWDALTLLSAAAIQQNTLVVAAGDLSHVGPAFGDSLPLDLAGKARIRSSDEEWLEAACSGDSDLLTDHLLRNGDPTRICGAAPIHYMMAILQGDRGRVVAYDQCPADQEFGSLVSIAGVLFSG
jgi:AmmeMemoRadiSam system protein B